MINLRFSRLPRHRKFNYSPVFYDESKEELHTRVDDIKREMGELKQDSNSVKDNIRRAYKTKQTDTRYGTIPSQKYYGLRLLAIISILSVISYKLWNSDVLEIIFGGLSK
jgi:hypothetical protein